MELPKNITPVRMASVVKHSENLIEALTLLDKVLKENETAAVVKAHATRVQEALDQINYTTTPLQRYITGVLNQ